MPTYQYRCQDCSNELEVVQKFTDDALTDCPDCDGSLRKVYSAVGVVFKGSGFYATDNRSKSTAAKSASASKDSGGESASAKPAGETKTEAKPGTAAKTAAGSPAA